MDEGEGDDENLKVLIKFIEHLTEMTLSNMYKPEFQRLTIQCTPSSVIVVSRAMRVVGFKMLLGKAPTSGLERMLSETLDTYK